MSHQHRIFALLLIVALAMVGPAAAQRGQLDFGLSPRYGTANLSPADRFPYEVYDVDVSGAVDTSTIEGCVGFTTEAPTFRVIWSDGRGSPLRFSFFSDEDTTLIVNTATGQWVCNDDSGGSINPMVEISSAPDGQYDIWIGHYARDRRAAGTLNMMAGETSGPTAGDGTCDTPLRNFDPQVIDDSTVYVRYSNDANQVFSVLVTGEEVGTSRLEMVWEIRLCLLATGPQVFPNALAADTDAGGREATDEEGLIALEITVEDIGELISQDYEVQMALDPWTPFSVTLSGAKAATITSLCSTRNTSTASLYNPYRVYNNPSANRVYQIYDSSGGGCAAMRRSNGTTLYVTARQLYVSGSSAYFTIRSTFGNFN
ncbi:MAG: hypothetical protein L6Q98_22500 [Anaerolineae bacterium]|nr:hypothetical protein [Anaerolineae bacterium]NUQ06237.1 hypothetical protein [Anaerolineae bacterium]